MAGGLAEGHLATGRIEVEARRPGDVVHAHRTAERHEALAELIVRGGCDEDLVRDDARPTPRLGVGPALSLAQVPGGVTDSAFALPDEPTDIQAMQLTALGIDPADFKGRVGEVQQAIRATFEEMTGVESPGFGIDGCSAPNASGYLWLSCQRLLFGR